MTTCPHCSGNRLVRSHARWWERPRRWATGASVYKCARCRTRVWRHTSPGRMATLLVLMAAAAIGADMAWLSQAPSEPPIASRPAAPRADVVGTAGTTTREPLVLTSLRSYTGAIGDFRFIEGTVQNETTRDLDRLQASCTWFDENDAIVATESREIDAPILAPGQTANFRVMTRARPDLHRFAVAFTERGIELPTRDASGENATRADSAR